MFWTKKKKWDIDEEYLELLDGKKAVVIGTVERSVISGKLTEIVDCLLGLLDNLESCTDADTVLNILDLYISVKKGETSFEEITNTPAPKRRGRPKKQNKEVK